MTPANQTQKKSLLRRLFTWAFIALFAIVVLLVVAVINNNHSFHQVSRAEFTSQLDHGIETSTQWIVQHPEIQGNPPLMFMVGDMAEMSGDPKLHSFVESYLASQRVRIPGKPVTWYYAHWVDPKVPVPIIPLAEAENLGWQDRWFTYATSPDRVSITAADHSDLFSPTKYSWGVRLHLQLIALDIYRHFNGSSPQLDSAIDPVVQGVARDAYWDFRVNDSYYQRSAFIQGAGRPDLINSRWIERILDHQHDDGSWSYCWYGWCRGVFEFSLQQKDYGHSTVQAAWALYMLKYRYSDWIAKNYH